MTTAALIQLDDERLIREGESAVDDYNRSREQARRQIIPMARGLLAARRKYPADRDFGDWLHTSSYRELGADERAALIKIGEHENFASKFIRTTRLVSPQTIWDAIDELLPVSYDTKPTDRNHPTPETAGTTSVAPANVDSAVPETRTDSGAHPIGARHPFAGQRRADEIAAIFWNKITRKVIGGLLHKRGGRDLWSLILETVDAGLLSRNSLLLKAPTLRVLFPDAPAAFARTLSLDKEQDRKTIRDRILPAAIACKEEITAAPNQIAVILQRYDARQAAQAQIDERERRLSEARQSMASHESEVVLYGKHFWPILHTNDPDQQYDYEQLRAAAWFFDDALKLARGCTDNDAKSCGVKIRHLTKRFIQFNETMSLDNPARARWRHVLGLVHELSRLMERSPDHIGNRLPLLPLDRSYE